MDKRQQRAMLELVEAALDLPEAEQSAWLAAQGTDPVVIAGAQALLARQASSVSDLPTGLPGAVHMREAEHDPPASLGPWRITGTIGRGGMGVVYAAERDAGDFERRVAVKVIHPGLLSPALVDRFTRERQTLARLEHPHIATLYDGGQTADGAPWLAMELVDGAPLSGWLADARPDLATRLARFAEVLDAVAFAHRNLVIHRDLTPANILVTETAGVKLIDFGISRPSGEAGSGPRATATPGFAAPEAEASTLTDIFALGKLLELLIAGQAQPELAAIAARASADDPAGRYATVEALAVDMRRWQGGFPVNAFSRTRAYRLRKFISRNRLAVGLGSAAAAVLLAGVLALTQAYRSEAAARAAAEQRFAEVRELSNFMLFDLFDQLEPVPGNIAALNAIADKARLYLSRLARIEGAPREVLRETALANKRLADVLGGTREANLGRREEAYEVLTLAIAELEALHRAAPRDHETALALAEAYQARAAIEYVALEDNAAAALSSTLAANLYRELARAGYRELDMRLREITARTEHSMTHGWEAGQQARGVREFAGIARAMAAIEQEFGSGPQVLETRANMQTQYAATLGKLAYVDDDYSDLGPAIAMGYRAIASYEELLDAAPDRGRLERLSIIAYYEQAIMLSALDRDRESLPLLARAEGIARGLLRRDPEDQGINRRLTMVLGQAVIAHAYAGEGAVAAEKGREVIARKRELLVLEPQNEGRLRELSNTLLIVGEAHEVTGDPATACRHFRESLEIERAFLRRTGEALEDPYGLSAQLPARIRQVC